MSLDLQFVRRLVEDRNAEVMLGSGIQPTHLFDAGRAALDFVLHHFTAHGVLPALVTIENEVAEADFSDITAPEPLAYYAEKIKTRAVGNVLCFAERDLMQLLKEKKPWEALTRMREVVAEADREFMSSGDQIISVTETSLRRLREYEVRSQLHISIDGIPSGWPYLDRFTMGWHRGEFIVIAAVVGTGKSWMLTIFAERCLRAGKRVLFVQPEMRTSQIATRFDTVYANVSHHDLKRGTLGVFVEDRYREKMRELFELPGKVWVAGNASMRTVSDIKRVARQLNPDVILVDSFYKMKRSGKRRSTVEEVQDVSWELRVAAQELDLPIIASSQFNRDVRSQRKSRKGTNTGTVQDIGYSYAIPQDADVILVPCQDAEMKTNRIMALLPMKIRDDDTFECLYVHWDHETGNYSEIGPGKAPGVSDDDASDDDGRVGY